MSNFSISITGNEELQKKIATISDPQKLLDGVFTQVSNQVMRNLVIGSQGKGKIKTGNTARAWIRKKNGLSSYSIENDAATSDKKHLIANIINSGHGEIRPIRAKMLYIPLTERGVNRGVGYKKGGAELGVDFIFANRVKPTQGTKFIDDEKERATKDLTDKISQKIKEVFN